MNEIKRLGDAELEIMQIIWKKPGPITSKGILENLKQRQWQLSTLMTSLDRLADKGFLLCDRTMRTNQYSAKITESDYKTSESKLFLEKLYDNSLRSMVVSMCDSDSVDKADLMELRAFLDSFTEDSSND